MEKGTETSINLPLRVLFVSHAYVVGMNQGKLKAIAEAGIEVGLLVPSNWQAREWNRSMPVETPYKKIRIFARPVVFSGRGGAHMYNPWHVWQILTDFKPDLVQVEQEVFSLCAFELAILSRITNKPLIVFGWENMQRRLPLIRKLTCQFVLNTASFLIPGNQEGEKVLRQWGYQGSLAVMPQIGVDTHLFTPDLVKRDRQQFNIGFLGRLVPEKGIELLLSALQGLVNRGFKCHLILCGSGSQEKTLRQQAKALKIENCVSWQEAIPHQEAPAIISQFDVLVLPSRTIDTWKEQFGHVLIEAMAMGIPVIGSTCGEIPNVIQHDELIFPEEDVKELIAILERMIRDQDWQYEMGQHGITMVQENYSHQRIAKRLIGLWKLVCEQAD